MGHAGVRMQTLVLAIEGMSCGHCLHAVSRALGGLDGVALDSVRIGRAEVRYDTDRVSAEQIVLAVTEAGYPARPVAAEVGLGP